MDVGAGVAAERCNSVIILTMVLTVGAAAAADSATGTIIIPPLLSLG